MAEYIPDMDRWESENTRIFKFVTYHSSRIYWNEIKSGVSDCEFKNRGQDNLKKGLLPLIW